MNSATSRINTLIFRLYVDALLSEAPSYELELDWAGYCRKVALELRRCGSLAGRKSMLSWASTGKSALLYAKSLR